MKTNYWLICLSYLPTGNARCRIKHRQMPASTSPEYSLLSYSRLSMIYFCSGLHSLPSRHQTIAKPVWDDPTFSLSLSLLLCVCLSFPPGLLLEEQMLEHKRSCPAAWSLPLSVHRGPWFISDSVHSHSPEFLMFTNQTKCQDHGTAGN